MKPRIIEILLVVTLIANAFLLGFITGWEKSVHNARYNHYSMEYICRNTCQEYSENFAGYTNNTKLIIESDGYIKCSCLVITENEVFWKEVQN
jgi:hypothetical protein